MLGIVKGLEVLSGRSHASQNILEVKPLIAPNFSHHCRCEHVTGERGEVRSAACTDLKPNVRQAQRNASSVVDTPNTFHL